MAYPFRFNNTDNNPEIATFDGIYREVTELYGSDLKYIRSELANEEPIFGEYLTKVMKESIDIRLFVEQIEQFDGPGNMYTKFGLQLQDEMVCFGTKSLFVDLGFLPKPQDLIFFPITDKLFEVTHIDDERNGAAFYPLGENISYRIQCKLYNHDYREIDDSIGIDIPEMMGLDLANDDDIIENNLEIEDKAADPVNPFVDNSEDNPLLR